MSYMSGMMIGMTMARGLRQMLSASAGGGQGRGRAPYAWQSPVAIGQGRREDYRLPAPANRFELVSAQLGRRRYRVAHLSPELAKLLMYRLPQLTFVESVQANPLTGSLLILYSGTEQQMDELAEALKSRIFGTPPGKLTLMKEATAGEITKSVRGMARDFSEWLKSTTCGWLDLNSALSLVFLFRGLRKTMLQQQLPSGPQMIWWAVSLMRGWRIV